MRHRPFGRSQIFRNEAQQIFRNHQDLSANELRLLMALTEHSARDGVFVASDAAQRIFKRQTTLGAVGIDVRGRAVVFRKNYRNTSEILRAARSLPGSTWP